MEEEISAIEMGAARFLDAEIRRLEPLPEPGHAFDARRGQYSSVEVMRSFVASIPPGDGKVIGICDRDLFIPMLTFVFGQAQLGGRSAVVSLARLRQEFYGLPPDESVLIGRAVKEVVHELGHTYGLVHCPDRLCSMSVSTDVRQVDAKRAELCVSCAAVLRRLTAGRGKN